MIAGGRAIAQAVSLRLPTAATRVRTQVRSYGICGRQSGTGAGFLRVLLFPLPVFIPPTASHSSSIVRSWYNRPVSGRRAKWTHRKKLKTTTAGDTAEIRTERCYWRSKCSKIGDRPNISVQGRVFQMYRYGNCISFSRLQRDNLFEI
jgi:hypothetical protein